MTYRVRMIVGPDKRELVTQFAGCTDMEDAKAKAEASYQVLKFKTIEEVKDGKSKKSKRGG